MELSVFSFGIFLLICVMACGVEGVNRQTSSLQMINNELVRLIDNCTVGDLTTCPTGNCCTKTYLHYQAGYSGDKPLYQLECEPLRKQGEFCYFDTPEHFCPCETRCHTNGFYGACL